MSEGKKTYRINRQDVIVIISITWIALFILVALKLLPVLPMIITGILSSLIYIGYAYFNTLDGTPDKAEPEHNEEPKFLDAQARLADRISDAVTIIDQRERIIYANQAARTLLGIETPGRPLSTFIREPSVIRSIQTALSGGSTVPTIYHIEDPVEQHIRVIASSLLSDENPEGEHLALAVFYDITEFVIADGRRADFLANASHELKTPVASLLGYIETLRGHAKDDPIAREKFLGIMQSQAERMQRLINDLLSLRRIEQIEHIAPTGEADLALATRIANEICQPLAQKRNISVELTGPDTALITGSQDEVVQVILNLLDNAVKMSPRQSVISLRLRLRDNLQSTEIFSTGRLQDPANNRRIVIPSDLGIPYYVLDIRDNGPGFSREHLPRIGERFYRIAGDRSSQEKGTGLGLAIVKHLILRHRAGLYIQSAVGAGTIFTVAFPKSGP